MTAKQYRRAVAGLPVVALLGIFAIAVIADLAGMSPRTGDEGLAWGAMLVFFLVAVCPLYVPFALIWLFWMSRSNHQRILAIAVSGPATFAAAWATSMWALAEEPAESLPFWGAVLFVGGYLYLAVAYGVWRVISRRLL